MKAIYAWYGRNVEALVEILSAKGLVEFKDYVGDPTSLADAGKMIVTPNKTYIPAKLAKRVAWTHGINHKRIKKELSRGGRVSYVPIMDRVIGEVDRIYVLETEIVFPSITKYTKPPEGFKVIPLPKKPGIIIEAIMRAAASIGS